MLTQLFSTSLHRFTTYFTLQYIYFIDYGWKRGSNSESISLESSDLVLDLVRSNNQWRINIHKMSRVWTSILASTTLLLPWVSQEFCYKCIFVKLYSQIVGFLVTNPACFSKHYFPNDCDSSSLPFYHKRSISLLPSHFSGAVSLCPKKAEVDNSVSPPRERLFRRFLGLLGVAADFS